MLTKTELRIRIILLSLWGAMIFISAFLRRIVGDNWLLALFAVPLTIFPLFINFTKERLLFALFVVLVFIFYQTPLPPELHKIFQKMMGYFEFFALLIVPFLTLQRHPLEITPQTLFQRGGKVGLMGLIWYLRWLIDGDDGGDGGDNGGWGDGGGGDGGGG